MVDNRLTKKIRRARRSGTFTTPKVKVVRTSHLGETVFFSVNNPKDSIQKYHMGGEFYEMEELQIIGKHFPVGGVLLDVGANVGNHSLYCAKFLHASLVIPVEPNPVAIDLLLSNIFLNGVDSQFDLSGVGHGLSDKALDGFGLDWSGGNLGGAKMSQGEGDVSVIVGDDLVGDRHIDMIKMDVEGMEIAALKGLEETIKRCQPPMFIEVDNENKTEFLELMHSFDYEPNERYKRYASNENYLVVPKEN